MHCSSIIFQSLHVYPTTASDQLGALLIKFCNNASVYRRKNVGKLFVNERLATVQAVIKRA